MPSATMQVQFCEFDLDGTLVNSIEAVEAAWVGFLTKYPHLNEDGKFIKKMHGVRVLDIYRMSIPEEFSSDEELFTEAAKFDNSIAHVFGHLGKPIPGAAKLTQDLEKLPGSPWCIVTSGSRFLATSWFDNILLESGYAKPEVFVTADDVVNGKPHPEGYSKGCTIWKEKVSFQGEVTEKVVFEDAPAGIKAGIASGCKIIGITTSADAAHLYEAGADYVVDDMSQVTVESFDPETKMITLRIEYNPRE